MTAGLQAARDMIGVTDEIVIHPDGLSQVNEHHQVLQPSEAMETSGDWLDTENPRLSWGVALGRACALFIDPTSILPAQSFRTASRAHMRELLGEDAVLAIPTTPFAAPAQGQRRSTMWDLRARLGRLTTIAGMTFLP